MSVQRLHVLVSGRVQGVFYRATAEQVARELGLHGWVRNLPDGRVEAIAEGPIAALEAFETWCRRGPAHVQVSDLAARRSEASGEFQGFRTIE